MPFPMGRRPVTRAFAAVIGATLFARFDATLTLFFRRATVTVC